MTDLLFTVSGRPVEVTTRADLDTGAAVSGYDARRTWIAAGCPRPTRRNPYGDGEPFGRAEWFRGWVAHEEDNR